MKYSIYALLLVVGANFALADVIPETLAKLHAINQSEIDLGQLAKKKGQAPGVRDYAKTMMEDHKAADKKVKELAKAENIDLKNSAVTAPLEKEHNATLNNLKRLKGPDFDREYLKAMEEGHTKAIDMLKTAKSSVDEPRASRLFEELLPTLENHHDRAASLEDRVAPKGE
jgi:putative membrane protein